MATVAAEAQAEDVYQGYERLRREAEMSHSQFSKRVKTICRAIKADCEQSSLAGEEVSLTGAVPLYKRDGYLFEKVDTLTPVTPFTLHGSIKVYLKIITVSGEKYLIVQEDFNANFSSSCEADYQHCIMGIE